MAIKITTLSQKIVLAYGVFFILLFLLNYVPAVHDQNGLLFGSFRIDLTDDIIHLIAAIWALVASFYSPRAARFYLICFGILYLVDGISPRVLVKAPHMIIGIIAVFAGLFLDRPKKYAK